MSALHGIRREAEHITNSCNSITAYLIASTIDADEWRMCLGVVDELADSIYALKRSMLNEAVRRNKGLQ